MDQIVEEEYKKYNGKIKWIGKLS